LSSPRSGVDVSRVTNAALNTASLHLFVCHSVITIRLCPTSWPVPPLHRLVAANPPLLRLQSGRRWLHYLLLQFAAAPNERCSVWRNRRINVLGHNTAALPAPASHRLHPFSALPPLSANASVAAAKAARPCSLSSWRPRMGTAICAGDTCKLLMLLCGCHKLLLPPPPLAAAPMPAAALPVLPPRSAVGATHRLLRMCGANCRRQLDGCCCTA